MTTIATSTPLEVLVAACVLHAHDYGQTQEEEALRKVLNDMQVRRQTLTQILRRSPF